MEVWMTRSYDLLLCAAFALILWAPIGRWALARLGRGELPQNLALAMSLGIGIWGLLVLALGWAGLLYRWVLLLSGVVAFVLLRLDRHLVHRNVVPARDNPPARHRLIIALMSGLATCYIAIALTSSLAPETNFDALNVHLPYARDAATLHRAGFDPNNWSSAMPALPLMTYITAFLFSGVTLAKLFNALSYVLCGVVIFVFVRRWWGRVPALAAALLFWSCPVAIFESTTALIDLPLTLYSSVAVLAFLEWTVGDNCSFLQLSALSLGLGLGCKYHAAFWIAPLGLVLVYHSYRRRHALQRSHWSSLAPALRYLGVAAALLLPWLIRAWIYTGNPVFPAANGLFKSPYFPPPMQQAAAAAYANEGVGRSVLALLRLPWTVTFHPGPFRGTLGFTFLLGVITALFRCRTSKIRYGLFISGAYFYTWALTAQDIRYLLPLVPLLSVIAVAGIFGAEQAPPSVTTASGSGLLRSLGLGVIVVGSLLALPWIYPVLIKEWTYWHAYQAPVNYLLGRESRESFLSRDVPSIYVYDYINANLDRHARILLLNDASQFYSKVPTLYSFTVEADRLLFENSEAGILRGLKESGITHVLLNYNGIAPLPGVVPRHGVSFFLDKGFQERWLEPLFSRNKVVLFKVRAS